MGGRCGDVVNDNDDDCDGNDGGDDDDDEDDGEDNADLQPSGSKQFSQDLLTES